MYNNNSLENSLENRVVTSYLDFVETSNSSLHNIIDIINQQQSSYNEILNRYSRPTPFSRPTPYSRTTPISRPTPYYRPRPTQNNSTYNSEPYTYRYTPPSNLNLNNILQSFLSSNVTVRPSQEQIELASRRVIFNTIENPLNLTCPINQIEFNSTDEVIQLIHCRHIFSTTSILQWFERNVHCPLCRHDIRDSTENTATTENTENTETTENAEPTETTENTATTETTETDTSDQYTFEFVFR